ncbi:MAG: DsbE family thiol:disulfide interchange protein [Caulobacter sp.]|nr:DsbE family thiol:disulfide interchange protein [Caulobacter sp.]
MKRWLAFIPLIALALLAVLFAGYSLKRNPQIQPSAMVGRPLPAIALPALETGQPVAVRDLATGPVLINFFASWCAPCELEHPALMRLKAAGVTIIGVAYKDAPANSNAYLRRLGDPFAARLLDRDGRAGLEFGVTGVPESYLIAADGTIAAKFTGELTAVQETAIIAGTRR